MSWDLRAGDPDWGHYLGTAAAVYANKADSDADIPLGCGYGTQGIKIQAKLTS